MIKFRRQFDNAPNLPGVTFELASETIPDQSLSLRELLINHTRGIAPPVRANYFYDENNPHPDLETMDLVDVQELSMSLADTVSSGKDKLKKLKDASTALQNESKDGNTDSGQAVPSGNV